MQRFRRLVDFGLRVFNACSRQLEPACTPAPRLCVDLVPRSAWFSNLRSELSPAEWRAVQRQTFSAALYRCVACGGRGNAHPVECHEQWEYDDRTAVQRLIGCLALCPACHQATHYGLARIRGRAAEADAQLMRVNGWSHLELQSHVANAMTTWKSRSEKDWRLDATWLLDYVDVSEGTRSLILAHAAGEIYRKGTT